MRKILDYIGVRLYALRYEPEYRIQVFLAIGYAVTSVLLILDICKTEVF